jgi:hypothetical protein
MFGLRGGNVEFVVYLAGVCLLGLAHGTLKQSLPPWFFVVATIAWLLFLRLVGKVVKERFFSAAEKEPSDSAT